MKITEKELKQIVKEETKKVMEENDVLEEIPSWASVRAKAASIDPRLFNKRKQAAELLEIYEGKFVKTAEAYAKKMGALAGKLETDLKKAKVDELAEVQDVSETMKKMVSIASRIGKGTKGKFKVSIDALRAEERPRAAADDSAGDDDDDREMSGRELRMQQRKRERTAGATEE